MYNWYRYWKYVFILLTYILTTKLKIKNIRKNGDKNAYERILEQSIAIYLLIIMACIALLSGDYILAHEHMRLAAAHQYI